MAAERAALRRVVKEQTKEKLRFQREQTWAKFFLKTEGLRNAAPEVVERLQGRVHPSKRSVRAHDLKQSGARTL